MCTLTIIPAALGLRIAFNRDELRARASALPPEERAFGRRRALLPIDPDSGGTWIGVNDAGLALALLNRNLADVDTGRHPESRGAVVPRLLEHDDLAAAAAAAAEIDPRRFRAFRLVAMQRSKAVVVETDGRTSAVSEPSVVARPWLFTSSGLGDRLVEGPRRVLFDERFGAAEPDEWAHVQDAFHRHRWPDRGHLSVDMTRPDAHTVSLVVIDWIHAGVSMDYIDGHPGQRREGSRHVLPQTQPAEHD